jgi:hypothetical protein
MTRTFRDVAYDPADYNDVSLEPRELTGISCVVTITCGVHFLLGMRELIRLVCAGGGKGGTVAPHAADLR